LILFFSLFAAFAEAASFNCEIANIEKLICSNPEISALDENLSKSYIDTKSKAQTPELLTRNQLKWLERRNKCKDELCLKNEYKSRAEFLARWLKDENGCAECWPSGSAMGEGLLAREDSENKLSKLKKKHDELVKLVASTPNVNGEVIPDSRVISALTAQQSSWKKYEVDECELIGSLSGAGGSWPSTYATMCERNLIEERLLRVNSAIKCIKKIPLEKRWMDQSGCLQQLAPMANKL
jgi:uncharacterized protein